MCVCVFSLNLLSIVSMDVCVFYRSTYLCDIDAICHIIRTKITHFTMSYKLHKTSNEFEDLKVAHKQTTWKWQRNTTNR